MGGPRTGDLGRIDRLLEGPGSVLPRTDPAPGSSGGAAAADVEALRIQWARWNRCQPVVVGTGLFMKTPLACA